MDIRAGYGSAEVLHGISIDVDEGEVAVILGANGVGKTTMLRTIAGLLRPWSGGVKFRDKSAEQRLELIFHSFPILDKRRTQMAGSLSGGEQRMLAVARALMSEPTLLLVDEPSMGLSPAMVSNVLRLLDEVRRES